MPAVVVKDEAGRTEIEARIGKVVDSYRQRSERARETRADQNRQNWDLYWGRQDWSHKQKHQSKEFLPDLPIAVEQIAGVIERALTDFADWFDIQPVQGGYDDLIQQLLIDPITLAKLLTHCFSRLYVPGNQPDTAYSFPTLIADAVKLGICEAIITLKVYGVDAEEPRFRLERVVREERRMMPEGYEVVYPVLSQVVQKTVSRSFRLAIEPIPWEDHFPDPSGQNLYDIHEVTRSIAELRSNPAYDPAVVGQLERSMKDDIEAERERRRRSGQDAVGDEDVFTVRVQECWGDLIEPTTGDVLGRNMLVTTVGPSYILRPPSPNPFWHGRRPFVKAPLLRVPFSVVHKALLDHAGPMAKLMNEIMNLMIDGGMAAVWGVRQVRPDMLENPDEITDGIPQGYTAVLKPGAPTGEKAIERVDEGALPPESAYVFTRIERGLQTALATPDLKLGMLPPRQVKATEVVEAMQASGGFFESIVARLEDNLITPTLELAWMTIWQYLDDFSAPELIQLLGPRRALTLTRMSPQERFVRLAQAVRFRVTGLRAIFGMARDYQKLTVLLQTLMMNPAFAAAFDQKYSTVKLFAQLMKAIRVDPTTLEKPEGAAPELPRDLLAGAGGAGSPPGVGVGPPTEQAMAPTNPTGERGAQS